MFEIIPIVPQHAANAREKTFDSVESTDFAMQSAQLIDEISHSSIANPQLTLEEVLEMTVPRPKRDKVLQSSLRRPSALVEISPPTWSRCSGQD